MEALCYGESTHTHTSSTQRPTGEIYALMRRLGQAWETLACHVNPTTFKVLIWPWLGGGAYMGLCALW